MFTALCSCYSFEASIVETSTPWVVQCALSQCPPPGPFPGCQQSICIVYPLQDRLQGLLLDGCLIKHGHQTVWGWYWAPNFETE